MHVAAHAPPRAAERSHDLRRPVVVLVGDLADDLFGQILQCHDSAEDPVLVDHARQLVVLGGHGRKRLGQRHERRHDRRCAHDVADPTGILGTQQVDQLHDADRLVVVHDRIASMPGRHERTQVRQRQVRRDAVGPVARDHRVLHVALGEVDDAIDHQRQLRRQIAAVAGLGDEVLEVVGRGTAVDVFDGFDAKQAQKGLGRPVEDDDQPPEDAEIDQRRARERAGQRIRRGDREILRIQLPEDHLHDRGQRQGDHRAHGDAHRRIDARAAEERAERLPHQRLGDVSDEEARDRDAELGSGEHERRATGDPQSAPRSRVAAVGSGAQTRSVHGHERELLRDEEAVGDDDRQDHDDAEQESEDGDQHGVRARCSRARVPAAGAGRTRHARERG